ncbi:MAG: M15 family metallopeptidase, partial [Roseomonas sp.]|nr:M15 family metallopeptidase [Roseomonas sp.]
MRGGGRPHRVVHTWPLYAQLASAVKAAARQCGVPITWGGDWASFPDGPHFEFGPVTVLCRSFDHILCSKG